MRRIAIVLSLLTTPTFATDLVVGAKISSILNKRRADDAGFVIFTTGGTGPCVASQMTFYPSYGSDAEGQKRAYAAAMLAMANGSTVTVSNEDQYGSDCNTAIYLRVNAGT